MARSGPKQIQSCLSVHICTISSIYENMSQVDPGLHQPHMISTEKNSVSKLKLGHTHTHTNTQYFSMFVTAIFLIMVLAAVRFLFLFICFNTQVYGLKFGFPFFHSVKFLLKGTCLFAPFVSINRKIKSTFICINIKLMLVAG